MRGFRVLLVATALVVAVLPRAAAAAPADPCGGRTGTAPVLVVLTTRQSLQSAVCGVRNNGTVFIVPGVYTQQVRVVRKHVRIVGLGDRRQPSRWPEFRAATPERALGRGTVTVGDRGGLTLRRIRFSGGDTQISLTGAADSLNLSQVQFRGGWDGVVQDSPTASLQISEAGFVGQKNNGVSVNDGLELGYICTKKLFITDSFFWQQANVGILIKNCEPPEVEDGEALIIGLLLQNLDLQGQGAGGLLVIRSGPFAVANVHIQNAAIFGIAAVGSDLEIHDSEIEETIPRPSDGFFGDGVISMALGSSEPGGVERQAHVTLDSTHIHNSARAGISVFGSSLSFADTTVSFNGFDLNGEEYGGLPAAFLNLGGNTCGAPPTPSGCVVQSSGMTPPPSLVEPM